MTIWMIWAQLDSNPHPTLTLVDAWDDDAKDGNMSGWEDAVKKAETSYGARNIRIATTFVDLPKIEVAFRPVQA